MARIYNSIVIVNFNAKTALLALLKSLRLQESTSGEVIVVDSASFDGSAEVAEHFPTVKLLQLKSNRGFFAAANKGIDQAVGDVVVLCHADVIADIHTLADLADETREAEGKKVAAMLPQLVGINDSPQPFVGSLPKLGAGIMGTLFPPAGLKCGLPEQEYLTETEWGRFVCVAFNRELLNSVGAFDEKFFLYAGDTDLCARIHARKMRVAVSDSIRVKHAGADISKQIPSHLMRILRKDQQRYGEKHLTGWQKSVVNLTGSVRGLFDRSK